MCIYLCIYIYIYRYIHIYVLYIYIYIHTYIHTYIYPQGTPGPHNKNPRHKTFAKGWVAQKHIFDRYLDGCAKIFQYFPRVGSETNGIF